MEKRDAYVALKSAISSLRHMWPYFISICCWETPENPMHNTCNNLYSGMLILYLKNDQNVSQECNESSKYSTC